MTDNGIKYIKETIEERSVYTPADLDIEKLATWIDGYKSCMNMVFKVLEEIEDGSH